MTTSTSGADAAPAPVDPAPLDPLAPPRLLPRPAAPLPPPPPIAQSDQVAQLHRRWAQLHGAPAGAEPEPPVPSGAERGRSSAPAAPRIPGGVRAKVRARVATAAAGVQHADRAITDDLVRAVDALAQRVDELSVRLVGLETLVQEVVDTVSEDLVRLRVSLDLTGTKSRPDQVDDSGPTR